MHRIFKKLWRYFPDSLGIRESFREIAARRKRFKCHNETEEERNSYFYYKKRQLLAITNHQNTVELNNNEILCIFYNFITLSYKSDFIPS